ncbi:hypothetical protein [Mycolicibacterium sphagni]|uniref:Peptidase M6-like domain-containing protein n=1 Tax=Mycolicibacterium sphagni TaxID=1786 RepID=A0ABX2K191_9MYCO|nr:hypothetical protein [Mycolicibacterium sphagni]NTY61505.1 hypothetical protein [Mycolicibacterium sphagni]
MGLNSPWAILRCKWNDIDDEPLSDDFVEKMFTTAGTGTLNMVDFFDKMSHGNLDLSGSQVFGWFTLPNPHTDYVAYGGKISRTDLVTIARSTATANGVDLSAFPHQVVLMNLETDLFGLQGGSAAVCDLTNCRPSELGQEMGHPYGLDHSRGNGGDPAQNLDYGDPWDIMSTERFGGSIVRPPEFPNGPYGPYGPGLNAANMRARGWLDRSRVLTLNSGKAAGFPVTVQLRPLHTRELPGFLALEIDDYIVEFRDNHEWDLAIDSGVIVHSFSDNHSWLERNSKGQERLNAGDSWELGDEGITDLPFTRVLVTDIDGPNRSATLNVTRRPGRKFNVPVGGETRPPWVDGGGFLGGSAQQSVVVQPGDDLLVVVDHLVAFKAVENLRDGPARDAAQRAAMEQVAQYATAQLGRLSAADDIRTPAPQSSGREREQPL